jgi:hypothetical protein
MSVAVFTIGGGTRFMTIKRYICFCLCLLNVARAAAAPLSGSTLDAWRAALLR